MFVVTDGKVGNKPRVIELVQSFNREAKVSAIGIGQGSDLDLIRGIAEAGNGNYKQIFDNEEIRLTVINSLK